MKYIKEYNTYFYSTKDFSTDKKMISMRDVTIEYLDKLYDIIIDTVYVRSDGSLSNFTISNSKSNSIRCVSIDDFDIDVFEYEDEWYFVKVRDSIYWCDQLDGLVKCIDNIKKMSSCNENTYIDISSGEYQYGSDIISISDYDIKIIEDNVKLKFEKKIGNKVVWYDYCYKGPNPQPYLDEINISISIFGYSDEWFKVVATNINDSSYLLVYWCDQVEGVIDCINDYMDKLKSESISINESKYYKEYAPSQLPPGVEDGNLLNISNKDIAYIKKELGIDTTEDKIGYFRNQLTKNRAISFYYFFYNSRTGKIDNRGGDIMDSNYVRVYSYIDEWYKVLIYDRIYWCDQVEGVVQCIKDSINKDVNSIKESIEYYYLDKSFRGKSKSISGKDINTISSALNIKFKQAAGSIYIYYNLDTHEVMDMASKNCIYISILSYADEWFRVFIGSRYSYWCDQVEGVIRCIGDFLSNPLYDGTYIKESVEYYYPITSDELYKLLDDGPGNLTYKFSKDELSKLEFTGCTFRLIDGSNGFALSFRGDESRNMDKMIEGFLYKLKDEWYLVDVLNKRLSNQGRHYYKCDQIDGLVELFKKL